MTRSRKTPYASRSGVKLEAALAQFRIDPAQRVCADLGSHTGGFVDVLLRRGAGRVYAVDTGYGVLDYRLRRDPRVVVMERTNALHLELPESVGLVTIDVGWTRQGLILPVVRRILAPTGEVISLIKPHYEADAARLRGGVLDADTAAAVLTATVEHISQTGWSVLGQMPSPILGHAGNVECLVHLRPTPAAS
jgi:23S rRNA (cytidine1920-2'-O)/16S rRNA (cytidine1409-2'-O)-methyltransferase